MSKQGPRSKYVFRALAADDLFGAFGSCSFQSTKAKCEGRKGCKRMECHCPSLFSVDTNSPKGMSFCSAYQNQTVRKLPDETLPQSSLLNLLVRPAFAFHWHSCSLPRSGGRRCFSTASIRTHGLLLRPTALRGRSSLPRPS